MSQVQIDEDGNTINYLINHHQPSTTQYVLNPAFKCEVVESDPTQTLEEETTGEDDEVYHEEHIEEQDEPEEEYQIVFTTPGHSSSSSVRRSPPKQYFCVICGNTYKSSGSLKLHTRACEKNHTNESSLKNRTCEVCGKVLASPTYLKEHMSKHFGKDVIKCTQCYRKFFDEEKYKKHLEVHEKEFDLAGQFLRDTPMDDKKVVKQYTCSFCSKDFVVVFDNKQAKRRYACDECREKYSNEHELKKRKEEMMGNQEFICTKCNRKFVFEGFLQRHMTKCDGSIKRKRETKTGPHLVHE
ncbi:hypothetical protein ACFFRR_000673 [Megaselia abdita]